MSRVVVTLTITPDTTVEATVARASPTSGQPFVALDLGSAAVYFGGYGEDQLAQLDRLIHVLNAARVDLVRLEFLTKPAVPEVPDPMPPPPPRSAHSQRNRTAARVRRPTDRSYALARPVGAPQGAAEVPIPRRGQQQLDREALQGE